MRALAKDYPSIEARNEAIRLTAGLLLGFHDGALRIVSNMDAATAMLSKHVGEIEHVSRFDR